LDSFRQFNLDGTIRGWSNFHLASVEIFSSFLPARGADEMTFLVIDQPEENLDNQTVFSFDSLHL